MKKLFALILSLLVMIFVLPSLADSFTVTPTQPTDADAQKVARYYSFIGNNGITYTDTKYTMSVNDGTEKPCVDFNYPIYEHVKFFLRYYDGKIEGYGLLGLLEDQEVYDNWHIMMMCFSDTFAETREDTQSIAIDLLKNLLDNENQNASSELTKDGYQHTLNIYDNGTILYYIIPMEE